MSREKKKGTSGNAKAFITRGKALKKLQLSLQEFRRLCILKGIYPRDPRKKLEGSDKTYYLRKDIDFLAHERLIATIRQQNAHKKKEVKARAKRRIDVLKRLALSKPKARLDHLVVERYPHFTDAVREIDDPICVIALFANLPADHKVGIAPSRVANCQRLLKEFHNFVAESRALKRVFVSIKGYYFQAKVSGELVTWITPHRFSQVLPADVDYSVMLTFLELYECILSFVNFRLYTNANLAYPPKIGRKEDANGLELASMQLERVGSASKHSKGAAMDGEANGSHAPRVSDAAVQRARQMILAEEHEEEDVEGDEETEGNGEPENDQDFNGGLLDSASKPAHSVTSGVFASNSFVLGREVPYVELEFALKAAGALRVIREDDLSEGPDRLSPFTHWVIDRPKVVGERNMSLEYIQPQYVFDSINAGIQLPASLYAPGSSLPPHLSPFATDEDDGGYRPWFKDVLERIKAGDKSVVAEAAAVVYAEDLANANKKEEGEAKLRKEKESSEGEVDSKQSKQGLENQGESAVKREEVGKSTTSGSQRRGTADKEESEKKFEKRSLSHGERNGLGNHPTGTSSEESHDEDDNEELDEEGEEERVEKGDNARMETESKEMATLMLSRKKMKQYTRQKREEKAKNRAKERLTAKRKQLDAEREEAASLHSGKKRRKR